MRIDEHTRKPTDINEHPRKFTKIQNAKWFILFVENKGTLVQETPLDKLLEIRKIRVPLSEFMIS